MKFLKQLFNNNSGNNATQNTFEEFSHKTLEENAITTY